MKSDIEELRNKYIKNPPEGMTPRDIRQNRRFLYLLNQCRSICMPAFVRAIFVQGIDKNRTFL